MNSLANNGNISYRETLRKIRQKHQIKPNERHFLKELKQMNWYLQQKTKYPNSNIFIHNLTQQIKEKFCLVVDGGGTALYAGFQSPVIKLAIRII